MDLDNNQLSATDLSKSREVNTPVSKPYMGDLTSEQIGLMAKAGALGGEMVRRMIKDQENQLMDQYNKDQLQ